MLLDSRESRKRNCKLPGPQTRKPCNLKSTKPPKNDSRSVGQKFFTGDGGRITHAAARCRSIFDNAGIAAVGFERRARGWRDVRRAKLAEAGGPLVFFRAVVARRRRCCRNA